jgi:hypothetical protein
VNIAFEIAIDSDIAGAFDITFERGAGGNDGGLSGWCSWFLFYLVFGFGFLIEHTIWF